MRMTMCRRTHVACECASPTARQAWSTRRRDPIQSPLRISSGGHLEVTVKRMHCPRMRLKAVIRLSRARLLGHQSAIHTRSRRRSRTCWYTPPPNRLNDHGRFVCQNMPVLLVGDSISWPFTHRFSQSVLRLDVLVIQVDWLISTPFFISLAPHAPQEASHGSCLGYS